MALENRRSFVKKSMAASISVSSATFFSSLIRARGEEGGGGTTTENTTTEGWETTYAPTEPPTGGPTTEAWDTTIATAEETTVDPWETTIPPTEETTIPPTEETTTTPTAWTLQAYAPAGTDGVFVGAPLTLTIECDLNPPNGTGDTVTVKGRAKLSETGLGLLLTSDESTHTAVLEDSSKPDFTVSDDTPSTSGASTAGGSSKSTTYLEVGGVFAAGTYAGIPYDDEHHVGVTFSKPTFSTDPSTKEVTISYTAAASHYVVRKFTDANGTSHSVTLGAPEVVTATRTVTINSTPLE
ncbi:MAG: hypothetical protein QM755_08700 [Luteolibacter sp.]